MNSRVWFMPCWCNELTSCYFKNQIDVSFLCLYSYCQWILTKYRYLWILMSYFDNFITKFMINNRIDPWKTKVSLLMHPFLGILLSTPHTCKNNDQYIKPPLILFLLLKRVSSPFRTKWGKRLGTLFGEKSRLEGMSQTIVLTCVSSNNQVITSGKIFLKRWLLDVKECGSGVSIHACQCIS